MNMMDKIRGKVIVSVQAMPDEPLYNEVCMRSMMASVINGGASALRVAGVRDVKNAKTFNVPVIGITKPNKLPDNWKEIVYITPTLEDVDNLIKAGADIIAFDGTSRIRPNNCTLSGIIDRIHSEGKLAMADISNFEEGKNCASLGADIVSTTLSGYTKESETNSNGPDFDLLKSLTGFLDIPVILEGKIWEPSEVKKAFEIGAYSVVIGSAITRPQYITKRFANYNL